MTTTGPTSGTARSRPRVTVITIARDRRDHLRRQRHALEAGGVDIEHVIVDMGGEPIDTSAGTTIVELFVPPGDALPLAAARNRGADASDAELLIFLDVDCIPSERLIDAYVGAVRAVDGIIAGPVAYLPPSDGITDWSEASLRDIGRVQPNRPALDQPLERSQRYDLFWSLSFALSRSTWRRIGGFDERYVGYGGEDTDFARTAEALGVHLWFDGESAAFHQHHEVSSPPRQHLHDIVQNSRTFHRKWGEWPMQGWLTRFRELGLVDWDPVRGHLSAITV